MESFAPQDETTGRDRREAEAVSLETLAAMFAGARRAQTIATAVGRGDYAISGATLRVWQAALARVQGAARDAGINGEIPAFIGGLMDRAIAQGLGGEDVTALIKVLRRDPARPAP
jgi:3-hydroxyisobutyrate dehydrogenase-like beta-hydroxyacid dehydrogenase